MKCTYDKGITLIALVITIIVLLILAGVSIAAITGENGLIARAQESVMLTKLADILFDLENDMITAKMDYPGQKFNTTSVFSLLCQTFGDKYQLSTGTTSNLYFFTLENSPIPQLTFSYNGDVYVDNYKRAQIQLSDYFESENYAAALASPLFGSTNLKVNDGDFTHIIKGNLDEDVWYYDGTRFYYQEDRAFDFILTQYMSDNYGVIWMNSHNEILGIGNDCTFMPLGVTTEHNLAAIEPTDDTLGIYALLNNHYVVFPTIDLKIYDNHLIAESQVSYFIEDIDMIYEMYSQSLESDIFFEVLYGGMQIDMVGVAIFDKLPNDEEESDFFNYIITKYPDTIYLIKDQMSVTINEETGFCSMSFFNSWNLDDIKETVQNILGKTSRIYYAPAIQFHPYDADEPDSYSSEYIGFIGGTIKHLDW